MVAARVSVNYQRRKVALTQLRYGRGSVRISTVRLSVADELSPKEMEESGISPYETAVFGGPLNDLRGRYVSRSDAKLGHRTTVRVVRAVIAKQVAIRERLRDMHSAHRRRGRA